MPSDPFYFGSNKKWRALRLRALARDNYKCVWCSASVRGKNAARCDHIKPRQIGMYKHLEYTLSNLRTLCVSCDNKRHCEKAGSNNMRGTDEHGNPTNSNHPWAV